MIITAVELVNFRNYQRAKFDFGLKTVLVGDNGVGKTNVLEAIYMLASGKSFRADRDDELIKYGENHTIIQCQMPNQIGLRIFINEKKRFEVNGVARRMMDFVGNLRAVKFGPEDMEIITGSPSGRRKYLDMIISQKDREYRRSLVSYEKGLRQRNKLLDLIREGTANRSQLYFWDKLLIKDGNYITESRENYLKEFEIKSQFENFNIQYDKSVISEERLKKYENEEVAAGSTLVGPHRDDFIITMDSKDMSKYGSRGQQRMAILALKIHELRYLTFDHLSFDSLPVLLLDDVFSELDHRHRDDVLKLANEHVIAGGQVIMTTSDKPSFANVTEGQASKDWSIISL